VQIVQGGKVQIVVKRSIVPQTVRAGPNPMHIVRCYNAIVVVANAAIAKAALDMYRYHLRCMCAAHVKHHLMQ
jgi:hypothetical protein